MANPPTSCHCRHGTVEDLVPGVVIHTHAPTQTRGDEFSFDPDHADIFDRWMIIGVMTSGGALIARWVPNPASKLPSWARTEGTIHPTELEPRLASDNVRIEVAE